MKNIRAWFVRQYGNGKQWLIALLVSVGLIAGVAVAQPKEFSWTNPTLNEDGTLFDAASELQETRIYCDIDATTFVSETPVAAQTETPDLVVAGIQQAASKDFVVGSYECFATSVSVYGYESQPSNIATFTITPSVAPSSITDFGVTP